MASTVYSKEEYLNSETMIFYGKWIKSIEFIPADKQLKFIDMVIHYGCFGIEPDEADIDTCRPLWNMIKTELDEDHAKLKERVEKQRKASKAYRERHKTNKTNDSFDSSSSNSNSTCNCNGNSTCNSNSVSRINMSNEYLSNQNNISSSSSSKEDDESVAVAPAHGGDDGGGNFSSKKKRVIRQCSRKGVNATFASDTYDDLEAMDFKIAGKPITSIVAFITNKWVKKKEACATSEAQAKEQATKQEEKAKEQTQNQTMQTAIEQRWNKLLDGLPEVPREFVRNALTPTLQKDNTLKLLIRNRSTYDTLRHLYPDIDIGGLVRKAFP